MHQRGLFGQDCIQLYFTHLIRNYRSDNTIRSYQTTLLAFIGYFLVYLNYAWNLFQFPFDYDQGEGFELVDTLLFSQGQWPYRDINSYPFYSSNYPPLFHVIIVPLVWLFGPQYWTGRLVSFVGTIITALAIGYAVQRAGKRWWLSTSKPPRRRHHPARLLPSDAFVHEQQLRPSQRAARCRGDADLFHR